MAAKDNMNSHLFSDLLEVYHGVGINKALEGWARPIGSREVMPPDQFDEWEKEHAKRKGLPIPPPRIEVVGEILENPRPINDIVHDWMMNHTMMGVGREDVAEKARDLRDLSNEIRGGGTAPIRLHRGAPDDPVSQAQRNPLRPLSFTEDPYVARSFARGGGRTFKVEPGTVRGIHVPSYVTEQRTVGPSRRPEREWLIDPDSIIGRA